MDSKSIASGIKKYIQHPDFSNLMAHNLKSTANKSKEESLKKINTLLS